MGGIFSYDSPLGRMLGRVGDLVILSLLWVLGCVPLVTAGASTAALYTAALRIVRGEEQNVLTGFWEAWKSNLKQGIVIHLILTGLGALLFWYWSVVRLLPGNLRALFFGAAALFFVLWLMEALFVYPVLARFENKTGTLMKNAWLMAAGNILVFLGVAAVTLLPLAALFWNPGLFLQSLLIWILLAPGTIAWLNSFLFDRCFRKYMGE